MFILFFNIFIVIVLVYFIIKNMKIIWPLIKKDKDCKDVAHLTVLSTLEVVFGIISMVQIITEFIN